MFTALIHRYKTAKKRKAILDAAKHLQLHPGCYDWRSVYIPYTKDDEGDALGWIGYFMKLNQPTQTTGVVASSLGFVNTREFYEYMARINDNWNFSAETCAISLMRLAQTLFNNDATIPIPDLGVIECRHPDCNCKISCKVRYNATFRE